MIKTAETYFLQVGLRHWDTLFNSPNCREHESTPEQHFPRLTHEFELIIINLPVLVLVSFIDQLKEVIHGRGFNLPTRMSRYNTVQKQCPRTVAQSPSAYTSPSGAPLTRRCASTTIAFL